MPDGGDDTIFVIAMETDVVFAWHHRDTAQCVQVPSLHLQEAEKKSFAPQHVDY